MPITPRSWLTIAMMVASSGCAIDATPGGGDDVVVIAPDVAVSAHDAAVMLARDAAVAASDPDAGAADTSTDAATTPPARVCTITPPVCDMSEYNRARAFAAANPTHSGGSWEGWCAALAYRFSDESHAARPSAIAAYHASSIVSTDASAAPIGALHYWDITVYGHVGVDLEGGGTTVFMASNYVADAWAPALGVQSVGGYNSRSGARYLGWSMDYAGSHIPGGGGAACTGGAPVPDDCALPPTDTASSGSPDGLFWMHMQRFAAANGYTGPVDGVMGVSSWAGVQRGVRAFGYAGPDDGVPGAMTYEALQRIAATAGYTGPVDGVLGANSYKGLATYLNAHY